MKKNILLVIVALVALTWLVPTASANPLTLTISNGTGSITVTGTDLITWMGSVGNYDFNVTIGAQGLPGDDFMHLNSLNISSANASADPLIIEFTAESLTKPTNGFEMAIGGVLSPAGATGIYEAFYDSSLIGTIGFDGITNWGAFNYTLVGPGPGMVDPHYSLTQRLTLNANGANQVSFSGGATLNPVPEPSAVVLLGSGLFALAWVGYRRNRSKPTWNV